MDKKNNIKTDYSALYEQIPKYINGTIEYPELKHTTAPFGIYKQRNGNFMARIRVTGGEVSLEKLSAISKIAEKYSVGFLHLTSRQAIQLHDVDIKNIIHIVKECTENNMPFRGGGGDTFRNVAVCPHSGFSEDSVFDVLPYAKQLASLMFNYDKAFDNLPRKIKFGFSCCKQDTSLAKLQDLGFIAKVQDGVKGFAVYGGGGMGNQSTVGIELKKFISSSETVKYAFAMTDLFNDHGDRTSRSKARVRFILKKLGPEEFKRLFFDYLNKVISPGDIDIHKMPSSVFETELFSGVEVLPITNLSPTELLLCEEWKLRVISDTGFDNIVLVNLLIPHGKLQVADLKKIVVLMSETKSRFARLSREENMYIPIRKSDTEYFFRQINNYRDKADFAGSSLQGLITSCIGANICFIGIIDAPKFANSIAKKLDSFFNNYPEFKADFFNNIINSIKISGCPNSCSNHPSVALGFQGIRRKNKDGVSTDYCKVYTGGRPDKLNDCFDGLLLDSTQIGIFVYDLIKKYYVQKKNKRELSFNDFICKEDFSVTNFTN